MVLALSLGVEVEERLSERQLRSYWAVVELVTAAAPHVELEQKGEEGDRLAVSPLGRGQ